MSFLAGILRRFIVFQLALAALLSSLPSASLVADTFSDRRAHVGLKLFRTLVAADLRSGEKLDPRGELPIYLVYASNDREALGYRDSLREDMSSVHEAPVRIEIRALEEVLKPGTLRPAAIFIAQRLDDAELARLVRHSIDRQIILFSPFEGDVEKGVLGGLSVEATVRPLINMRTLSASRVAIKDFYLKVAKRYGSGPE